MKKSFYICLLAIAAFAAVACEDKVTREDSPAFNADAMQVYFPVTNESSYQFDPSVKEFDIAIAREKATEAAEVKVKISDASGLFTIPATVKFDAGDADTVITVSLKSDAEPFVAYQLILSVDDDSKVNPYIANANGTPEFAVNVMFTDYLPVAKGTFTSGLFQDSWEQVLYHSDILDSYFFLDCYEKGYSIQFTIASDGSLSINGKSSSYGKVVNVAKFGSDLFTMFLIDGAKNTKVTFCDPKTKTINIYCYVYGYNGSPYNYANKSETFVWTEGDVTLPQAEE